MASPAQPLPARRPSRLRRTLWAVLSLAVLLVVSLNGCTAWLEKSIIWGPNTNKQVDPAADPRADALSRLGVDRALRVDVGPPSASLSPWVVDPPPTQSAPRATVLILHGINDRKETMLGVAKDFAARGYRAVLVDLRAHGRSGGQWLTFGAVESKDLAQVLDALDRQGLLDGPLGAFGPSYGGAVAIQFAGRDPRVKAVVAVCPFTSMRDVTPGVFRMYAPAPFKWLVSDGTIQRAITRAGATAGFNPDDASPRKAIQRTRAPVLLIHGRADTKIPPTHSQRLHTAAPDHSRLVLLEDETHDSILAGDASGVILREATAWFDQWLRDMEDEG